MTDPINQTVPLDEQVWREWAHKGRLREQSRARRRRKVATIVAVVTALAFVIFYVTARP